MGWGARGNPKNLNLSKQVPYWILSASNKLCHTTSTSPKDQTKLLARSLLILSLTTYDSSTISYVKHSLIPPVEYNPSCLVLFSCCSCHVLYVTYLCPGLMFPAVSASSLSTTTFFFNFVSPLAPWQYPAFRKCPLIIELQWITKQHPWQCRSFIPQLIYQFVVSWVLEMLSKR